MGTSMAQDPVPRSILSPRSPTHYLPPGVLQQRPAWTAVTEGTKAASAPWQGPSCECTGQASKPQGQGDALRCSKSTSFSAF